MRSALIRRKNKSPHSKRAYQSLATAMKQLRKMRGLSLRDHAARLGISSSTLERIENGSGCELSTLIEIRHESGLSYETLLGAK